MNAVLASPVIAAIIAGVFALIGKYLENNQRREAIAQAGPALIPGTPPPALHGKIIWGRVLLQIGVIQLLANVVGVAIGYSMGSNGSSLGSILGAILVVNTILLAICFYVIGKPLDRSIYWKHLTYVAVGVSAVTLLIDLLFQIQITGVTVFISLLQSFFAMAIGGWLAFRAKSRVAVTPPPSQQQWPPR